jgi:hypothetical protein
VIKSLFLVLFVLAPAQFLAEDHSTVCIHSVNLKELLGDIQTNCATLMNVPPRSATKLNASRKNRDGSIPLDQHNQPHRRPRPS